MHLCDCILLADHSARWVDHTPATFTVLMMSGMGYSVGAAQCLVAPPFAFAGILMYCTAWVGDKYHLRGPILIFNSIVSLIGLPIVVSTYLCLQEFVRV